MPIQESCDINKGEWPFLHRQGWFRIPHSFCCKLAWEHGALVAKKVSWISSPRVQTSWAVFHRRSSLWDYYDQNWKVSRRAFEDGLTCDSKNFEKDALHCRLKFNGIAGNHVLTVKRGKNLRAKLLCTIIANQSATNCRHVVANFLAAFSFVQSIALPTYYIAPRMGRKFNGPL